MKIDLNRSSAEQIRDALVRQFLKTEQNVGSGSGDDFVQNSIDRLAVEFEVFKEMGLEKAAASKVFAIYGLRCLERDVASAKAAVAN